MTPIQALDHIAAVIDTADLQPGARQRAQQSLEILKRDVWRYQWLRDDNAYAPEESMCRGGPELDQAIDEAIAEQNWMPPEGSNSVEEPQ